jgi:two-component system, NtrC family, response regulator AlgB
MSTRMTRPQADPSPPRALHVLVVDDEKNIRNTLAVCLQGMGCQVVVAASADEGLAAAARQPFDLAFVDLRLGTASGLELMSPLLGQQPFLDVIVITAYASVDTAVEAIRRGARDYMPKPFTPAQVRQVVERVAERRRLEGRVETLEGELAATVPDAWLETVSARMQACLDLVLRAARSEAPVLLLGESGTGKGVLARALHAASARASGPFVTVACPTLSEELLAGELFGHSRGAFTGALRDRPGRVESAHGGSLFLDEIGELSAGLQAKLLRFLQDHQFERLGENRTRVADVRVVCATHRDLSAEVEAGRFRLDLLYRMNVVEVPVPALRERKEDLLRLARHFLAFFSRSAGRSAPELSKSAQEALLAYAWPGNIRELRNEMERAIVLSPVSVLEPAAFSSRIAGQPVLLPQLGGDFSLDDLEREHIRRVLARSATQEDAARILGIDVSTLWRKRKRYDDS